MLTDLAEEQDAAVARVRPRDVGVPGIRSICFDHGVHHRLTTALLVVGGALGVIGLVGSVVFQLQPWRTCPDDDVPAACAMLPGDYAAFLAFASLLLIGVVMALTALLIRSRTSRRTGS